MASQPREGRVNLGGGLLKHAMLWLFWTNHGANLGKDLPSSSIECCINLLFGDSATKGERQAPVFRFSGSSLTCSLPPISFALRRSLSDMPRPNLSRAVTGDKLAEESDRTLNTMPKDAMVGPTHRRRYGRVAHDPTLSLACVQPEAAPRAKRSCSRRSRCSSAR